MEVKRNEKGEIYRKDKRQIKRNVLMNSKEAHIGISCRRRRNDVLDCWCRAALPMRVTGLLWSALHRPVEPVVESGGSRTHKRGCRCSSGRWRVQLAQDASAGALSGPCFLRQSRGVRGLGGWTRVDPRHQSPRSLALPPRGCPKWFLPGPESTPRNHHYGFVSLGKMPFWNHGHALESRSRLSWARCSRASARAAVSIANRRMWCKLCRFNLKKKKLRKAKRKKVGIFCARCVLPDWVE
jgi:hypothetical protein